MTAIRAGSQRGLGALLAINPSLARQRSSTGHPTLLQCLVLDAVNQEADGQIAMAQRLVERGSPIDEPLIAAASVDNVVLAEYLLDQGAAVDGDPGVWTPLEESIYWDSPRVLDLLLERGAKVPTLRAAAGLGRVDEMERFFTASGEVQDLAGVRSPFASIDDEGASDTSQALLDNALTFAALRGQREAAALLLERGADVNSHPLGFHYRGTALHWAAIRGQAEMCDFLIERGADPQSKDLTIHQTPEGWARHDGHDELADGLRGRAG